MVPSFALSRPGRPCNQLCETTRFDVSRFRGERVLWTPRLKLVAGALGSHWSQSEKRGKRRDRSLRSPPGRQDSVEPSFEEVSCFVPDCLARLGICLRWEKRAKKFVYSDLIWRKNA